MSFISTRTNCTKYVCNQYNVCTKCQLLICIYNPKSSIRWRLFGSRQNPLTLYLTLQESRFFPLSICELYHYLVHRKGQKFSCKLNSFESVSSMNCVALWAEISSWLLTQLPSKRQKVFVAVLRCSCTCLNPTCLSCCTGGLEEQETST